MQNVIYAVIGVILTVAAMYMVAPSINTSSEAIKANLAATEVSAVKNAAKMWLANESTTSDFAAMYADDLKDYIPELTNSGTDATSKFTSKAASTITIEVAPNSGTATKLDITIRGLTAKQATLVEKSIKGLAYDGTATSTANTTDATKKDIKIVVQG